MRKLEFYRLSNLTQVLLRENAKYELDRELNGMRPVQTCARQC